MIRRRRQRDEDEFDEPMAAAPATQQQQQRLTPVEVQQKVFRLSFRGYNERDVDEFLDRVTEDLAALHEENKRLRESLQDAGGAPAALGATQRQAEQVVREAREHAARLVEDAERRANQIRSAAESGAGAATAGASGDVPVSFLSKEREFLRRLAAMVQEHARSLKEEATRARSAATEGPPVAEAPASEDTGSPEPSALAFAQRAVETEPEPPERSSEPSAAEVAAERMPSGSERSEDVAPSPSTPAGPAATPMPPPPVGAMGSAAPGATEPRGDDTEQAPAASGTEEERSGPWGPAAREPEPGPRPAAPWSGEEGGDDADPLISAWESAFVGGGPETRGTTPPSRPTEDADGEEEKATEKREDEPSLKELFWGEQ